MRATKRGWKIVDRYGFGKFRISDANSQAFRLCHAVAELLFPSLQPLVLYGPTGSGKTHLLHAVADRIQQRSREAVAVGISGGRLSAPARAVLTNPSVLDAGRKAVLLIDGLDDFVGEGDSLECLIRLFLQRNHCVIAAGRHRPAEISGFAESLRSLLAAGTLTEIGTHDGNSVKDTPQATTEVGTRAAGSPVDASGTAPVDSAALQQELARVRDELDNLLQRNTELQAENEGLGTLREECGKLRRAVAAANAERASMAAQLAAAEAEVRQFRAEVKTALTERDVLRDGVERLRAEGERWSRVMAAAQKREQGLRSELEQAQAVSAGLLAEIRAVQEQVHEADRERLEADAKLQECARRNVSLTERTAALEADKAGLQQSLREMENELAFVREEGSRAYHEVYSLVEQTDELIAEVVKEQERVFEAEQEKEQEHGVLAAVSDERDALWARLREMEKDNLELRGDIDKARARNVELEKSLAAVESRRDGRTDADVEGRLAERLTRSIRERDLALARAHAAERELASLMNTPAGQRAYDERHGPSMASSSKPDTRRLGEILHEEGAIDGTQLEDALRIQKDNPVWKLGAILVEQGHLTDDIVAQTVARQLGLSFVRLNADDLEPGTMGALDGELAKRHRCVPLSMHGNEITVAMADPGDINAIHELESSTNLRVNVVAAPWSDIARVHERYHGAQAPDQP